MKLDDNYQLIADDFNFILQRKRKRAKRSKASEWQNIGYWQDLGQALASYARRNIRDDMPNSLKELLALERALSAQIERIGERCVTLWGKGS